MRWVDKLANPARDARSPEDCSKGPIANRWEDAGDMQTERKH